MDNRMQGAVTEQPPDATGDRYRSRSDARHTAGGAALYAPFDALETTLGFVALTLTVVADLFAGNTFASTSYSENGTSTTSVGIGKDTLASGALFVPGLVPEAIIDTALNTMGSAYATRRAFGAEPNGRFVVTEVCPYAGGDVLY